MNSKAKTRLDGSSVDVVVIGAGFAGLVAADRLASQGRSVLVLEGRERIGGRAYSSAVAGVTVDLGATWVAERHAEVHRLMGRFGITTTSQFHDGDNVLWMDGERQTYVGDLPNGGPVDDEDLVRIQAKLDALVEEIDVNAAWDSPNAAELDAISFSQWLDDEDAKTSTRALMEVVTKVQWGCRPGDVSLLHALRYQRAGGGLQHMLAVEGGQQQDRVTGGFQGLAERLAEGLSDRIVLGAPVTRIAQEDGGVVVDTEAGSVRGRYVVSTTTPAHRALIDFEPDLPAQSAGLARTWRMGSLSKAFVAYEKPFWRSERKSGVAISDSGAVFITFDVSLDAEGPGVLVTFLDPQVYDRFNLEDRRQRVIRQLVDLYGEQAAEPIDYVDHRWGEEAFAPGGPNPAIAPYATTTYGPALAQPHGRIHWAGSETAGEWAGTLNGAVLTGHRAADEVAALLGNHPSHA